MAVEASAAKLLVREPVSSTDAKFVIGDPHLSPSEKLMRLRSLVETGHGPAIARGRDAIAVHRAIFKLYEQNPTDLKRHIYE